MMQQWIIIFYKMNWLAENLCLNDFKFEILMKSIEIVLWNDITNSDLTTNITFFLIYSTFCFSTIFTHADCTYPLNLIILLLNKNGPPF